MIHGEKYERPDWTEYRHKVLKENARIGPYPFQANLLFKGQGHMNTLQEAMFWGNIV